MASNISALVFITNGPPLAICSPIGFPDTKRNLDFVIAFTFNSSPCVNKINVESFILSWDLFPILISPSIR